MKFHKQTVRSVPIEHKTVLIRVDYNVPLEADGTIADDFRIRASLPTLQYLHKHGCKIVIVSHLGRPEGKDASCSLEVVGNRLAELLGQSVLFVDDCIGDKARMAVKTAPKNAIILLENLRFYEQEEQNDQAFARQLAKTSGAQYFVQDGFGVVHRAHASTAAVTLELPSVAGLLLEKEYVTITGAMRHPEHPLVAVLGGAKVGDKLPLLEALVPITETILIGGAMANTFLASKGVSMGKSKFETDQHDEIAKIYAKVEAKVGDDSVDTLLQLPSDVAVSDDGTTRRNIDINAIQPEDKALDIGEATIDTFVAAIERAKTVIWNGTLGYAEDETFSHGSARVAMALASHPEIVSIIGGGDTADFVRHWDSKEGDSFGHVSTGGGASLELMSGLSLPGIESLLDARQ